MNSNATAGISRARPRTCVCWVAIVASCYPGKLDKGCPPVVSRTDDSQLAARREKAAAGIDALALLDITGALHFTLGRRLRRRERRVDRRRAGQGCRKLLADRCVDALALRDR